MKKKLVRISNDNPYFLVSRRSRGLIGHHLIEEKGCNLVNRITVSNWQAIQKALKDVLNGRKS